MRVTERVSVLALAAFTALALFVAPWAALNRETGARSAVLLLPERLVDFTGRTAPIDLPHQEAVLLLTVAGLAGVALGAAVGPRARRVLWLAAGVTLIATTVWGSNRFGAAVDAARIEAFQAEVARAIELARPNTDLDVLRQVLADAPGRSLDENVSAAATGGLVIRRLPYTNASFGASAFLAVVTGAFAVLFGLRIVPGASRVIDRSLRTAAVPATAILLALAAAAVVILTLQPTPTGSATEVSGWFTYLVGRIDTLWYAYFTMFHDALGTVSGFAESLKFATPLIFTGLAVGFGFQAGLFNIGAPGQMVMGAIFAAMAAIYLPGPKVIVLPLSVLAAALGGGLWGALPGYLKARFGANEVINTILLNFVAASALLFILSAGNVFAAAAVRILAAIGLFILASVLVLAVPPIRRASRRAPRAAFAVGAVVLLGAMVVAGLPRPGDAPVTLNMPFRVSGNEPKSKELSMAARMPQLPAMVGIDIRQSPGTNVVPIDYASLIAPIVAIVALFVLPRWRRFRTWLGRILGAVGVGAVVYGVGWAAGLAGVPTAIPPTKLNLSFVVALTVAALVYVFLFRTKWGYELRAVGLAPRAAEYGGASIARNTVLAMAISGALAGLTATHYVLGGALEDYALRQSIPTSDGFDGIAVALLGANQPLGIVLAAFLFGVLKYGGSVLNITFPNLTREVVSMILALVVLFIAAKGFLPERITNPLKWARPGSGTGEGPPEAPTGSAPSTPATSPTVAPTTSPTTPGADAGMGAPGAPRGGR